MGIYHNLNARSYKIPITNSPPNLASIQLFHTNLGGSQYAPTPLVSLQSVAKELDVKHVLLKNESSRFGLPAFKILGASWAICSILADRWKIDKSNLSISALYDAARQFPNFTIVTATDGNHGRACARVASLLGIKSRIFVPSDVPDVTKAHIVREGGQIFTIDGDYDTAVRLAASAAKELGEDHSVLVQDTAWEGYEDIPMHIIHGYSTLFIEIDMQLKEQNLSDVTHCIVPVGVGSLAHSAVQYYKSEARPKDVSIITVEPATAACLNTSLHKGKRTSIQTSTTIMQGLNCGTVSSTAWPDLKGGVEVSTIVEEDEALLSVSELESLMIRAGPCGAATLAAARKLKGLGNVLSKDSIVVLLVTEGTIA